MNLIRLSLICICSVTQVHWVRGILDGQVANPEDYPYVVRIVYGPALRTGCTGILITERHVLTARSCVLEATTTPRVIIATGVNLPPMVYNVSRVIRDHITPATVQKLAILQLSEAVPACLEPIPLSSNDFAVEHCRVLGLGWENGVLRSRRGQIMSTNYCKIYMDFPELSPSLMCTWATMTKGFHDLDMGGAVIHNGVLVGVVTGCSIGRTRVLADLHMKPYSHMDFIRHHTGHERVLWRHTECIDVSPNVQI